MCETTLREWCHRYYNTDSITSHRLSEVKNSLERHLNPDTHQRQRRGEAPRTPRKSISMRFFQIPTPPRLTCSAAAQTHTGPRLCSESMRGEAGPLQPSERHQGKAAVCRANLPCDQILATLWEKGSKGDTEVLWPQALWLKFLVPHTVKSTQESLSFFKNVTQAAADAKHLIH